MQSVVDRGAGKRLKADGAFRVEAEWCVDHGIPWSTFLSWPSQDQDLVSAVLQLRLETCERCHTRKDEWGTYVDGKFVEHEHPPYVAKSTTDPGCAALDRKAEADLKRFEGKTPPGYRVTLVSPR